MKAICMIGLLILTACSSPGEEHTTHAAVSSTMAAPLAVSVRAIVLCPDENIWNIDAINDVFDYVSIQTGVHFNVVEVSFFHEEELKEYCKLTQSAVVDALRIVRQNGVITVVFTSERGNQPKGSTTVEYQLSPLIAMRKGDSKQETVDVFLHELGHQMDLRHNPTDSQSLTTDDYLQSPLGRDYFLNYIDELASFHASQKD